MAKQRDEGKAAFLEGRAKRVNPYRRFTAAWFEWMDGYIWAFTHYGDGSVFALDPLDRVKNKGKGAGCERYTC